MEARSLGRLLILANPTAHSGKGESAAAFATRFFSSFHSATASCTVRLTEASGDAKRMAALACEYDTVIALGGDGIIHETANGLMTIPVDQRPCLGIIPMGSGNDFARTLGITRNDPERSIAELLHGEDHAIDLGKVNDTYFVQTLSFGLDAAIALDTTDRRARGDRQQGSLLYVTSGLRLVSRGVRGWAYKATLDGNPVEGIDVAFAVQNGPTYGGGFRICPEAVPNDGLLDVCYTTTRPMVPHALLLFGLIRAGRHTASRRLSFARVRHLEVEFVGEEQPPCQADGERIESDRYVIDAVPSALHIIAPSGRDW